jgi:hypothetical protein
VNFRQALQNVDAMLQPVITMFVKIYIKQNIYVPTLFWVRGRPSSMLSQTVHIAGGNIGSRRTLRRRRFSRPIA